MLRQVLFSILAATSSMAADRELPLSLQAQLIKIIAKESGSANRVAVRDGARVQALAAIGVVADPDAPVAWAANESEVFLYRSARKLVVVSRMDWMAKGGAIALVEGNKRPQIYFHMGNIGQATVTLPEAILTIGQYVRPAAPK